MIKAVLQSIDGVEIFPLISLLLFFFSFAMVIFSVVRMKKTEINYIANLPLANDSNNRIHGEDNNPLAGGKN